MIGATSLRKKRIASIQALFGSNIFYASVVIAVYLYLSFFWQDIGLWDESIYYLYGSHSVSLKSFWNAAEFGPLYWSWYRVVGLIAKDFVWLYFVSWGLLVIAITSVLRLAVSKALYIYGLLALYIIPVFHTDPHAGLFCVLVILSGYSLFRSRPQFAFEIVAVSALFAGYVRPEYFYAIFLALLIYVVQCVIKKACCIRTLLIVSAIAILAAGIIVKSDTARSGIAFEQHFNLRASVNGQITENPWSSTYAQSVFPIDRSLYKAQPPIGAYFRANPVAFTQHIVGNLLDRNTLAFASIFVVLSCLILLYGRVEDLLFLVIFSAPVFAASLCIYPRLHYFVVLIPVYIALGLNLLTALGAERWALNQRKLMSVLAAGLVFTALAVNLRSSGLLRRGFRVQRSDFVPSIRDDSNIHVIQKLRVLESQLVVPVGVNQVFDTQGGYFVYLKHTWGRVDELSAPKMEDLARLIDGQQIQMYFINDSVAAFYRTSVAEIELLLRKSGYVDVSGDIPKIRVFVRSALFGSGN